MRNSMIKFITCIGIVAALIGSLVTAAMAIADMRYVEQRQYNADMQSIVRTLSRIETLLLEAKR